MDISIAVILPKFHAENGPPKLFKDYNPADYEILIDDVLRTRTSDFIPDPTADPGTSPLGHSRGPNTSDRRPISVVGSEKGGRNFQQLPRCRMSFDQEPSEVALGYLRRLARPSHIRCRRAVRVALWQSEPSTPSHSVVGRCSSALFCIPLLEKGK